MRHTWDVFDRYDPQSGLRSMFRTIDFATTSMLSLMARGVVT